MAMKDDASKTEAWADAYGGLHVNRGDAIARTRHLRREIAVDIMTKRMSFAVHNRDSEIKAWLMDEKCDDVILALAEAIQRNKEM